MQPGVRTQGGSVTTRRSSLGHISALDGARGLAVAGVLLFHGGHLRGGYLGVDFFFTLSGFLITSLLLAEANRNGRVNLGGFWARRARRLLPALAILMVGVAVYSVTLAKPSELAQIRGDAFATLGYVANWHEIFAHQSYFALFTAPSPLNHTWSLAIEEQFYVIWPLVFVGLAVRFAHSLPKAVLTTSLALAGLSSVLMIVLYSSPNTNRDYFGTDTRAAAILFGAALAAALAVYGPVSGRRARSALEVAALFAAVVLAVAWARLDGQSSTLYRGGFLVCGLAATAIIAAAVHPELGPVSRALSFRPLCWLGLISYGVYLYHWPLDVILSQQRVGLRGWPLFVVQTAVTLAVAIASYKIIEQPIRHGVIAARYWRELIPAIAVVLVIAIFLTTNNASPNATVAAGPSPSGGLELLAAKRAYQTAPTGARRIMLVGNSVAYDLGTLFEQIHAHPPLAVFDAAIPACNFPPLLTATYENPFTRQVYQLTPCHPSWEADTVRAFHPRIVFWIVSDAPEPWLYQGRRVNSCAQPYDSLYEQSLRNEIASLRANGATVVITTEAYVRFVNPGGGLGATALSDATVDCNNQLRRTVAAETGTKIVDLFTYICPDGKCRVKQDGETLRPDGLHYQGPGGLIVARWLMSQVH